MPDIRVQAKHLGDLHAAIQEAAGDENLSMSEYITNVLRQHLENVGEWTHAYSVLISHIEYVECGHCGEELTATEAHYQEKPLKFYRLYDSSDEFRMVVCENCLTEI